MKNNTEDSNIREEKYFFGIHSENSNLSKFTLVKETDDVDYTDYSIRNNIGREIHNEDQDIVLELAINLSGFGKSLAYDSVSGSQFRIVKLNEKDYELFIAI